MEFNKLITVEELADMLRVKASWIYQRTRLGADAIPFIRLGKYIRFNPDEVIEFFKKQKQI